MALETNDLSKMGFGEVSVLLAEPSDPVRSMVRSALQDIGIRDIRSPKTAEEFRENWTKSIPDLAIVDVDLPPGEICQLINQIRHNWVGSNPFVPIICTTWEASKDIVRAVVESGADELLAKPISVQQLQDRIRVLIRARKPFVVTSDYIGPDRRKLADRDSNVPLTIVPNVLAAKATGEESLEEVQEKIDSTVRVINAQKMERLSFQGAMQVRLVMDAYAKGNIDEEIEEHLTSMLDAARDLSRRMEGTEFEHISELALTLIRVATTVRNDWRNPPSKDLKLLLPVSQAIQTAFHPDREKAAFATDISAAIDVYKSKRSRVS